MLRVGTWGTSKTSTEPSQWGPGFNDICSGSGSSKPGSRVVIRVINLAVTSDTQIYAFKQRDSNLNKVQLQQGSTRWALEVLNLQSFSAFLFTSFVYGMKYIVDLFNKPQKCFTTSIRWIYSSCLITCSVPKRQRMMTMRNESTLFETLVRYKFVSRA